MPSPAKTVAELDAEVRELAKAFDFGLVHENDDMGALAQKMCADYWRSVAQLLMAYIQEHVHEEHH